MIINEWQTGQSLNKAVLHQRLSDFALVLAMHSPDVRDFGQFYIPESGDAPVQADLYQQFGLQQSRDYGWLDGDEQRLDLTADALHQGGQVSCQLQQLLQPLPWVLQHDAKKLADEVKHNLPFHCLHHLQQHAGRAKPEADATGLYDILQQLHAQELAA
ncbi:VC2046/SO_2500 family protein [Rheinheimera sp.]|uniref:VC2046/SO_2500 family protein n=1 Tax=Rheinheimera sp. TaxID=1869214 RepID=UPI00307D5420